MEIQDRVKEVIEESFPGCQLELEIDSTSGKVNGFLIWSGFNGMSQTERQSQLWEVLSKQLDAEAAMISTIFTHTPNEFEAMMAA